MSRRLSEAGGTRRDPDPEPVDPCTNNTLSPQLLATLPLPLLGVTIGFCLGQSPQGVGGSRAVAQAPVGSAKH